MNKKKMNRLEKASYLLKSKKAQGHVEIILSFTLFIGAIIILFIFINSQFMYLSISK